MTVKDAVTVLKGAKTIALGYGANAVPFDKEDVLMMDAFGSYKVAEILVDAEGYVEINIATQFVKEGA